MDTYTVETEINGVTFTYYLSSGLVVDMNDWTLADGLVEAGGLTYVYQPGMVAGLYYYDEAAHVS